jgi:ABC-type phosphate/phosphonate transport system substrate-binding protein
VFPLPHRAYRIARRLIAACALAVVPVASSVAADDLIFAINEGVTYRITPHETRDRYREVADSLSRLLKRNVRIEPVENYNVLRKGLADRRYELAYVHPAHIALAAIRDSGYQPVAVTRGWTNYRARFLVPKAAPLAKGADVRGQKMVIPDPDSITAWMTRATLRDLGLDPAKESLGSTRYQDGIPFMLENGFYTVGVTASGAVVRQWEEKGGRILFESKPIAIKYILAASTLPRGDAERVRAWFVELESTDRGRAILKGIGFEGFAPPPNEATLTEAMRWLGI